MSVREPRGQHYLERIDARAFRCGKARNRGTRWSLDLARVNCDACRVRNAGDKFVENLVRHAVGVSKSMGVPAANVSGLILRVAMLWERAATDVEAERNH